METLVHLGLLNAALATILALLAAAARVACRRPAVVHALWLLVLLKLVTPPLLPIQVATWPASEQTDRLQVPEVQAPVPSVDADRSKGLPEASKRLEPSEPSEMAAEPEARSVVD